MSYENSYNLDLARKLCFSQSPEEDLDKELAKIKKRALELDQARQIMAQGVATLLQGLKQAFPDLDLNDPNLQDSPNRMARAYIEICSGIGTSRGDVFTQTFPADNYNEVVMLKNIEYTSLCAHHFFPFTGKASIGYLPNTDNQKKGKVVGLSKLARIVDVHAQRPQLQERLCVQIMNSIKQELDPKGVMVVIEGHHTCLSCRGVKKGQAQMVTSALDGAFKESSKLRSEFLDLLKLRS